MAMRRRKASRQVPLADWMRLGIQILAFGTALLKHWH
jgi:hypothetical protein